MLDHCTRRRFVAATLGAALLGIGRSAGARLQRPRPLVIGKVSDNPTKHFKTLRPIVDHMASRMSDLGISGGEVRLAKSNEQMMRYLREGSVDWVTETAYSALEFEQRAGARILLKKWKKGVGSYHSVIFVRKDSGITSLEDLEGRVIAFEDPGATSSFFLPANELLARGMELVPLRSPRAQAPARGVGYVFSSEEINTTVWVHKGIVAAGAISDGDWIESDEVPPDFRDDLVLLHETPPVPRALELVRGDLEAPIVERLRALLLAAHDDPSAQSALLTYDRTTHFEALDGKAEAALQRIRGTLEQFRATME